MKQITLRFRAADRSDYNRIKDGTKSVETRAATEKYKDVAKGDVLVIVCGKERMTKTIRRVRHFKTLTAMFKAIPMKKIMPSTVKTIADARKIYYGYSGYKEKLAKFGVVAWEME
ncbi:MAG TPA: hypothetical protein PK950_01330 [Candidatus Paceibacterota bacterium]|nr:hypothetical protein [Candidatus Paceibacterota bacterium]